MTTTRSSETQVKHGLKYGQSYIKNRDVIWHKKGKKLNKGKNDKKITEPS